LTNPIEAECEPSQSTCGPADAGEASCRIFLCARCRSQVLVCRRCDRGQIYCAGTCAKQARRHQQREARRRYQATTRGRAMHADRNRRYRARQRGVTDHGAPKEHEAGLLPRLAIRRAASEPSSSRRPSVHWCCYFCGHPASAFLRVSTLLAVAKRPDAAAADLVAHRDSATRPGPARPRNNARQRPDRPLTISERTAIRSSAAGKPRILTAANRCEASLARVD
jgi:hypothetical protein